MRQMELTAACATLGVWDGHCDVLDIPELQDDPKAFWPHDKIEEIVKGYVTNWGIDAVRSQHHHHHHHHRTLFSTTSEKISNNTVPLTLLADSYF